MTQTEYEQKRRECWEEFCESDKPYDVEPAFDFAFDRAYALGKQEIKQEIKQEKDAEGEEILMISRKKVQRRYHMAYECKHSGLLSHDDVQFWKGWQGALDDLFGSKCLPDEHKECSNPSVVNCRHKHGDGSCSLDGMCYHKSPNPQEPKPAEPKLRRGSFAYHDNVKVRITKIKANGDVIAYTKDGYRLIGRECDFEPYTEPTEEASPNVNSSDIDIDELVAKGYVLDPAKQSDNILKDSFSKERRLNIAAQMMQGLICAPLVPGVDPNPSAEYLAQTAFRLADALIAEAEKGGDK